MKIKIINIAVLPALLLFFLTVNGYSQGEVKFEMSASKYLMGTEFVITAVHGNIDSCKKAMYYALREVERIENVMSNYRDSTEISRVNRSAYDNPVKVSGELFGILEKSIDFSKHFNGYFDITVGPLTNYWGFNSEHPIEKEPDGKKIKELLQLVDYNFIKLNYTDSTVSFTKRGVIIDLGGIAKGYALKRASVIMKQRGVNDFLINGGGDIYASGRKSNGMRWIVGIKDPRDNEKIVCELEAENIAICTSGDYERFKIINGVRYHHIFNPKNGFPSYTSQSATVITDDCELGVVMSKMLFILGPEGDKFFRDMPYYQIDGDGETRYNKHFQGFIIH